MLYHDKPSSEELTMEELVEELDEFFEDVINS